MDTPEDDPVIVVDDSDKDEENESQKHKLELEKNKAEAALLKAQPSFPNVRRLNELLLKSLQTKFSKILSAHDFSRSPPTELKELSSKFNELTEEVKGLLLNVIKALNKFTQVLDSASSKARDQSVSSAGQADTMPAEEEKNTNYATISHLFQKRAKKNAEKNLNSQQPKPIPPIITTTTQMQSPFQSLPKSSSQPEGEHIKKDKGKKEMSSEEAEKESTNIGFNDNDETHVTGSMVESSKTKKLKKFDFITEDGKHIHLTEDKINQQKKIEEEAKAKVAKHEGQVRKAKLVDLLGPEVRIRAKEITPQFSFNHLAIPQASIIAVGSRLMLLSKVDTATEVTEKITLSEFKFRIDYKSLNKVSVIVVLDLSKVANEVLESSDYSLWEVILNGDSPSPTRIVDGVVQIIASTTAEQSLPSEWKTHTLIWRNKADLEEQSLDDLFNNLMIYEAEVKGSSTSSQNTQNIAFVSSNNTNSTNESINVVPSVSVASTKAPVFTLLNVNSLSDAVIYSFFAIQSNSPQLDNEDLKQINPYDLEEIDLKWQMAMLTMRARRFLKRTGRNLGANGTDTIGFDMSKVECYNCLRKGHFDRECRSLRDNKNKDTPRRTIPVEVSTLNALVSQCDAVGSYDWSFWADEGPTNYALMAYASSGSLSSSGSDNETSLKNLSKLLESQVSDKTGLGFKSQVFNSQVFDCEEVHSHESDSSVPKSPKNDRYKLGEGYHVVPPPYTGTFMPLKPNLVFSDALTASESIAHVISDSEDETEIESVPKQKGPSFVSTTEHVKTPSEPVKKVEHPKQVENLRTNHQKYRGYKNSWNRKPCFVCKILNYLIKDCDYYEKQMVQKPVWNNAMRVNHQNSVRMTHPNSNRNVVPTAVLTRSRLVSLNAARPVLTAVPQSTVKSLRPVKHGNSQQAIKDKGVIDSGCSRHMTGNISFLLDFEEFNEGYVPFGRNPKGDPLGKFNGKADEGFLVGYSVNSKAFRVFNSRTRIVQETLHINFLENKPNVAGIGPTWLFDIDTLTKSMNYQPVIAGNQPNDNAGIKENLNACKVKKKTVSAQQYVLLPLCSTGSQDPQDTDADVADAAFDVKENENDVHVSAYGSDKSDSKKHDEKAKRDAQGKRHVDMPELEDIVYSDDEEDVGVDVDFFNLKTNISVSPIPTIRVHKDHHVNQIIGDLNSAPQTRRMERVIKEQGGLHQINDEDFHT
nr:hypothetical protein [Tanacetum cinerariifolium]